MGDKAGGAAYEAMADCVIGLLDKLPFKTVTSMMFIPEKIEIATISELDPQNENGDNKKMVEFIKNNVARIKSGELNQLPWDNEAENFGEFAWYIMAQRTIYYIDQISRIYDNDGEKHTVLL